MPEPSHPPLYQTPQDHSSLTTTIPPPAYITIDVSDSEVYELDEFSPTYDNKDDDVESNNNNDQTNKDQSAFTYQATSTAPIQKPRRLRRLTAALPSLSFKPIATTAFKRIRIRKPKPSTYRPFAGTLKRKRICPCSGTSIVVGFLVLAAIGLTVGMIIGLIASHDAEEQAAAKARVVLADYWSSLVTIFNRWTGSS
ncbi:hypothetical protein BO86DRAFT_455277 [Aspergillus japonicus CBS 114.51]|uniref:Uncharacterized protein n=1 Tax=Aspergillus japonicus CBS 114.51 TaxID=1448312 RepID=A0A8T8X711_ASPJA|nr:hypothetical protein BO86DRAFT_455277 [Aspergillus japonicus CBS 114.51]RAH83249.1 hypothetical protein BO86DRAFT_455277 [Aspergillus japonicus CBS 114.51]